MESKDLQIKAFNKIMMTNGYNNKIAQESIFKRTYSKHIFEQALAIGTF